MGSSPSTERHIRDEFARLSRGKSDTLVLEQLLQIQMRPQDLPLDLRHLGSLYVLDDNKDGVFGEAELVDFAKLYGKMAESMDEQTEARSHFQAFCTLKLLKDVIKPGGLDRVVKWLTVVLCDRMTKEFEAFPGVVFLVSDSVKTLHSLLNVQETYNVSFQEFFDTMQQVAEARGFMNLKMAELDDVVPVPVVQEFMRKFIAGFVKILNEIGFDKTKPLNLGRVPGAPE